MIGSPSIQHKPPEPGYIEVVHQTQNGTPKYKGVGGWESETATPRPPSVPRSSCDTGPWGTGAVGHRGDHTNDPLTLQSHDQLDHTLRRVSATVLVTVLREVVWPSKSETGSFGSKVGFTNLPPQAHPHHYDSYKPKHPIPFSTEF